VRQWCQCTITFFGRKQTPRDFHIMALKPFARKVEAVLASLGRQMCLEKARGMASTHINRK
jgi:hypothetical protein